MGFIIFSGVSVLDAPTPFSATPTPPKGGNVSTKTRKLPPQGERADDLRHTLTTSIIQKLQRMDLQELREVYNHAVKVMDKKKSGR